MRNETFPFSDPLGRPSDKPTYDERGITDNPLLFLGELCILKQGIGTLNFADICFVDSMLSSCRVTEGLYSRHPRSFQSQYNIPFNKMSHDENNGIAFIAAAIPALGGHLEDMVEYLENHHSQYYDIIPYSDFFKAFSNNPVETVKELIAYVKACKANPQDTESVDLLHDPNVVALTTLRQPRDIAFYRIACGLDSSLLGVLWLSISTILSTRRSIKDGSRGGTMLMTWFRNKSLINVMPKGIRGWMLTKTIKLFNLIMIAKYGKEFPVLLIDSYFDRVANDGSRHPMIHLVKKYVDKCGV